MQPSPEWEWRDGKYRNQNLNVSVIVEQDGRREQGGMGGGGRFGLDGLIDPAHWQSVTREALRIALPELEGLAGSPLRTRMNNIE